MGGFKCFFEARLDDQINAVSQISRLTSAILVASIPIPLSAKIGEDELKNVTAQAGSSSWVSWGMRTQEMRNNQREVFVQKKIVVGSLGYG